MKYRKNRFHKEELMDKKMLQQERDFYKARYEETEWEREKLKKIRHDMSNKYVLELSYLENKQYEKLQELYLKEIENLRTGNAVIETGNIGIDSVVNYKLQTARELSVRISHDLKIGKEITLEHRELNLILGNLLDNALEAVSKLPEKDREIDFKIRSDNTSLLIAISNTYNGAVKCDMKGNIVTGKRDVENHGIGLKNVKEVVDRYHGNLEITVKEGRFEVIMLIYMP